MAGSGVNVKMGVSGIAQFKQNINQAKQAVKTLDAQIALSEKQYKATGDAESYMTEKAELLKAKLEQQKTVVSTAEKALKDMADKGADRSSKAYQDMYRQMLQAKGEMLDTENAINGLSSSCEAAGDSAEEMNQSLRQINQGVSYQNVTEGIDKITGGMEAAAKKAIDLGKKIVKYVLGVGTWADDINTRSTVLGVSPEELQRMEKTATLIDTDAETIIKAKQKLAKGIGKDSKGTLSALEALGISSEGDMEETFWAAGNAIIKLSDETEQEAYANDLFGKSWHDLIPLFAAGREEYDKINSSWTVMNEEQLKQLNEMDDEYQKLKIAVEDLKREALSNLAEPMKTALEAVNELLGKIGDWLKSDEGKATVENIVTKITDAAKWIVDNKELVVGALGVIVAGWGALKLTGGALRILEVINGLKWLKGNPNIPIPGTESGGGEATGATGSGFGGKAASAAASVKGAIASNGASLFIPAAVVAAAIAPALIAQNADEKRWAEQRSTREAAAAKMTGPDREFLLNAAAALDNHYRLTGDSAAALKGLQNRGDIEKAQLFSMLSGKATSYGNYATDELLRFWQDDSQFDQARTDALLTSITDAYTNMTEHTDEITGSTDKQTTASEEMTTAANNLMKLPESVQAAIQAGMSGISFYLDGQAITDYVDRRLGMKQDQDRR